jgi:hypothetical protein
VVDHLREPEWSCHAGTFKPFLGGSETGPSKVFAFDGSARIVRTYAVIGQTRGTADAVQVSNVDRSGNPSTCSIRTRRA